MAAHPQAQTFMKLLPQNSPGGIASLHHSSSKYFQAIFIIARFFPTILPHLIGAVFGQVGQTHLTRRLIHRYPHRSIPTSPSVITEAAALSNVLRLQYQTQILVFFQILFIIIQFSYYTTIYLLNFIA
jgi:hypothetical protein